ncbi:hypothetical protein BN134_3925 [Cronobacter dublinensis 1210]|uniref:Uncharacterized protein n=1 Tax=Cronobacter dublinensis 1210 TaxID=1208656 RepID=A0ABP1WDF3_9ENTR|nr:hypothetical protein BN134_3925 [Cronobacter dublinensis 1210]
MRISAQILLPPAGQNDGFLLRKQPVSKAKVLRRAFYYSPQLIYERPP